MADQKTAPSPEQVQNVALELFKSRTGVFRQFSPEAVAIQAFNDASVFLEVAAKIRSGEMDMKPVEVWGADAFAPKLPRNHPLNMVSREWGDRSRVNRIAAALEKNTHPEYAYSEGDLSWDASTTNRARDLFPTFADKHDKSKSASN